MIVAYRGMRKSANRIDAQRSWFRIAVQVTRFAGAESRTQLKQPNKPLFTSYLAKQLERFGTSVELLDCSAHTRIVESRTIGSNQA
jgi:hypothetical protein